MARDANYVHVPYQRDPDALESLLGPVLSQSQWATNSTSTSTRPQAIIIAPRCTHIATAQPLCAPIGADDSDAVYAEVDVVLAGHELYELHEREWMTGWRVRGPCVM